MAGGIEKDPGIERWAFMRDNAHLYFRINRFTALSGVIAFVITPVGLYYLLKQGQVSKQ